MPDTAKGYVTAAQVATFLGLDPTNGAILTQITPYLGLVEGLVENYCGTTFQQEGITATDLSSTQASGWLIVTSGTYSFVQSDVNNVIQITSGTNFIPGTYQILSVSGGAATLSAVCGNTADAYSGIWNLGVVKIFSGRQNPSLFPGFYIQSIAQIELLDIDSISIIYTYLPQDYALKPDVPLNIESIYAYRYIERKYWSGGTFGGQGGDGRDGSAPFTVMPVFPTGSQNIRVTGVWGLPAIPDAIMMACCFTIQNIINNQQLNPNIASEAAQGRAVAFRDPSSMPLIPFVAQRLLDPWVNSSQFTVDGI